MGVHRRRAIHRCGGCSDPFLSGAQRIHLISEGMQRKGATRHRPSMEWVQTHGSNLERSVAEWSLVIRPMTRPWNVVELADGPTHWSASGTEWLLSAAGWTVSERLRV